MSEQSDLLRRALLKIEALQGQIGALNAAAAEPIALVGLGCRLPGGLNDPEALWQFLSEGRDAIGDIPAERWDVDAVYDPEPAMPGKIYTRRGGFVRDVDQFDPAFFGISPREAIHLDPQQRLLLEVSWEALERAGIAPSSLRGSLTGVYVGQATNDYSQLHLAAGDASAYNTYFATGTAASVASGRLSYTLGLVGPAVTMDTACSSSLVALHLACQALRRRECDLALVAGVNLILSPEAVIAMCQSRMMAPDGVCKTFDASADGFGQAEGCAVVVVKRLSDAVRDGDTVLALVRGSAVNQDGASSGLTAPSGPSQTAVIRAAFASAGIPTQACSYVEAHGTGTSLGDPIEIQAMDDALGFGASRSAEAPLWTGSIKTNLGHLEAAAGLAGLLKVVLSLQHKQIPPHLHFRTPNPLIPWDEVAVRVADRAMPFPEVDGRRVAGLSSFGFSGTNAHIVLEEAPAPVEAAPAAERPFELLTLSARGEPALRDMAAAYRALIASDPDDSLADLAFSANTGRAPSTHRLALVAESAEQAASQLAQYLDGETADGLLQAELNTADPPRIAFLFTGQGSQYPGMGRALYEGQPAFRAAFDDCAARFAEHLPGSLVDVVYGADTDALGQTQWTQPALFAIEWALAQLWKSWGIEPDLVIGHSIGEYAAACLAGVSSLDDAIRLVAARATLMGALPAGGAMTATMADEPEIAQVLAEVPGVSLAAVNGPKATTLSGPAAAIDEAERRLAAIEIPFRRLDVSHAFHSSLLDPMLDEFEAVAGGIAMAEPEITFVSTFTGQAARSNVITTPRYWRDQTRGTVRFADGVRAAKALGYSVFLELGPSAVLSKLAARTLEGDGLCVTTLEQGKHDGRTAFEALGRLYLEGAQVDWKGFHGAGHRRIALPTYPFQRQRYWLEAASHKPKPASHLGHPHLVQRTDSARGETIFDVLLDPEAHPYLLDHRVHGAAIVPTALYLDLIASAVAQVLGTRGAAIEDVVILREVAIPFEGRALQLLFAGDQFELFTREGDTWTLAVSGRFGAVGEPPVPATEAVGLDPIAIDRFYPALKRIGLDFGPTFHRIETLDRRDDVAESSVSPLPASGFGIHPAALDGSLQTVAAALPGFDPDLVETDVYMPIGIDRFELFRPEAGTLRSLATVVPDADPAPETRTADVTIADASGSIVARIAGVHMKRARIGARAAPSIDDLLYETEWRRADLPDTDAGLSALADFDGGMLASGLAQDFAQLSQERGLVDQVALEPQLDALCAGYVVDAFAALGWRGEPGAVLSETELLATVAPRHHRLTHRLLEMLAQDRILAPQDDGDWLVLREMIAPVSADAASLVARFPQFRPDILFAERGGSNLAAALRDAIDPAEVLFPGGSFELADELYRRSPAALVFNQLAASIVTEAVRALPADRPIRILEIGGGTGGVTSAVLPVLPKDRASYTFTDLSPAFLTKARTDFADYPFLAFECLDIEKPPQSQGFDERAYDLVIASNVLHATDDLARTIEHARSLLAPGGQMLVAEGLKPVRWIDLSFGLTDGWWRFSDAELRPDYPLLSAASWRGLLRDAGFAAPLIAPDPESEEWAGQGLILARLDPAATQQAARAPMVFCDTQGVGERLLDRLGDAAMAIAVKADAFDTSDPAQYLRLFETLSADSALPDTIAFLWPVDAELASDADSDALTVQLERACGSLLHLLQAYAATARGAPLKLWIVTRRAQDVLATDRIEGFVQAAVFGLAKVAALELPEIACLRFDIDAIEDIDALAAELRHLPDEPLVAIRDGARYVARLVPATLAEREPDEGRDLRVVERGSPDGLEVGTIERPTLREGEVEIRAAASGLNFRDVLVVLGARGDDASIGGEAAGVITRVGPGVQGLAVGDAVMAVTQGGHRDYVSAPAALTLPKPETLDWAQAGSAPLAFLTALYALSSIGEMKPGERVLVHAAAGGVGMAAIQLAQRAGLEVFATAGSAEKREAVAAMGVRHVYDSRALDFADAIRSATDGEGIDLVLAAVTGPAIAEGLKLLREGGRYLEIGKAELLTEAEARAINPLATYHALDLAERIANAPEEVRPLFLEIADGLVDGSLEPLPTTAFDLSEASQAFEHMARARHIGKVVLEMGGDVATVAAPLTIAPDATYLISGGLTGLGLASARRLTERGARHLLLFGRRAPDDAAIAAIEELRADGVEVVVASADASSPADLKALFDGPLAAMPPLRGVIHSAGRLEDATLSQQSWSRFLDVFGPKAIGGWALHRLCADRPLDFFVLYSSVSAVLGAPGQSNHAAANAFLDAFAAWRRAQGLPALSINWGAWSQIGAAAGAQLLRRLGEQGVAPMNVAEGLAALDRAMEQSAPQIVALRADWNRVAGSIASPIERRTLDALLTRAEAPAERTASPAAAQQDLRTAPADKRMGLLSALVKQQVAEVLGAGKASAIPDSQPFRDMGLDSLMALELRNRLKKALALDTPLPATMAFDYPTVALLLQFLASDVLGWEPAADARQAEAKAPSRDTINDIEAMSDEEIDRMLAARRAKVS